MKTDADLLTEQLIAPPVNLYHVTAEAKREDVTILPILHVRRVGYFGCKKSGLFWMQEEWVILDA